MWHAFMVTRGGGDQYQNVGCVPCVDVRGSKARKCDCHVPSPMVSILVAKNRSVSDLFICGVNCLNQSLERVNLRNGDSD